MGTEILILAMLVCLLFIFGWLSFIGYEDHEHGITIEFCHAGVWLSIAAIAVVGGYISGIFHWNWEAP